jgi:putative endopeptidase
MATDTLLSPALGALYTRTIMTPAVRKSAVVLTNELRSALDARLRASRWMGDSTRSYALEKLSALRMQVGTPDSMPDYASLTLSPTDYSQNRKAIQELRWRQHIAGIGHAVSEAEWQFAAYRINAAEHNESDMLEIPAVLWQPPLFAPTGDAAENYGGIGALVGHEMMHGFGTYGRYFGAHHVELNWIFPPDTAAFTQRTERLAEQFDAFVLSADSTSIDSIHVDGHRTLEEDLADLAGLQVAYDAFESATRNQPRQTIHGFTPEQRFFLAFANLHRVVLTPLAMRQVRADSHAPDQFRVNGTVSNMPAFANAFGCHEGDAMVRMPSRRVEIW